MGEIPNYELAEMDYMNGMKYKDIAEKYNVTLNTVKSWKTRYKWSKDNKKGVHTKTENVRTQNKREKPIDDGTRETMLNENLTHEQRLFCIYYSKIFNATQAYIKAYNCDWETANTCGPRLMVNVGVREEIKRLQELKRQQIVATESDIIDLHMRIAFADIGNYVSFGKKEVETTDGTMIKVNSIDLKESKNTDTQLIREIKQGKEGISIKLADQNRSLEWLDRYFLMNPMDKHKIDYDNKKFELECKKTEPEQTTNDGIKEFLKAVKPTTEDIKAMFENEEVMEDAEETEEE